MKPKPLFQNIVSLYGIQAVGYLVPLLTLPLIARRLGPVQFGSLAFAEAYASNLSILIEYGFGLSASRDIAGCNNDVARRSFYVSSTLAAQFFLACCGVIATTFLAFLWPAIVPTGINLALATLLAFGRSITPSWYFQGMENLKIVAILNIVATGIAAGVMAAVVHAPEDAWRVLALRAVAACVVATVSIVLALSATPFQRPPLRVIISTLRDGGSLFAFKSATTLYTTGNVLLLGAMASSAAVAWFAGAEKVLRVALSATGPISQAFYPKLSRIASQSRADAALTFASSGVLMLTVGLSVSIILLFGAPYIVKILLGNSFMPSVLVLRILAPLPLLVAISDLLGVQWMLPLRMDKTFIRIVIMAGLANISLAFLLVPRFREVGMAASVLISELMISVSMLVILKQKSILPFWGARDRVLHNDNIDGSNQIERNACVL